MNDADKSIRRVHEIAEKMGAVLPRHPRALSTPATRMPSAQELLDRERFQPPPALPDPQIPLAHRIVGWVVAVIVFGGIGVLLAWRG